MGKNILEYPRENASDSKNIKELYKALLELENIKEVEMFLTDLCTPNELLAMADRWKAVQMLNKAIPYREIYEKTGVSTATITRVARCLSSGTGGYRLLLERIKKERKSYEI
jgi:TrpR-related protein YerC/YecD